VLPDRLCRGWVFYFMRKSTLNLAKVLNGGKKQIPYSEKLKDPRWQKKRLEILSQNNFTCQYCGNTKETLHVHHYIYTGEPWEVKDGDATTLCESCHKMQHIKNKFTDTERELFECIEIFSMHITHDLSSVITPIHNIKKILLKKYGRMD